VRVGVALDWDVRLGLDPLTPAQVWRACQGRPLRPDLAIGDET